MSDKKKELTEEELKKAAGGQHGGKGSFGDQDADVHGEGVPGVKSSGGTGGGVKDQGFSGEEEEKTDAPMDA